MTVTRPTEPDTGIRRPVVRQVWRTLTYVHWPVPLTQVAGRLPRGLAADTYEGQAWVGLVPFEMSHIRLGPLPPMPWLGSFPQTNVRTYVIGPEGPGVWFDSFDMSRFAPVAVARSTYGLPYNWAQMEITWRGGLVRYDAQRRWPERNATSRIQVAVGSEIRNPDEFEVFVSSRWRIYTMIGKRLATSAISHEGRPLRAAHLTDLDDDLVRVAGYAPFDTEPRVMFSPGGSATIERPRRL